MTFVQHLTHVAGSLQAAGSLGWASVAGGAAVLGAALAACRIRLRDRRVLRELEELGSESLRDLGIERADFATVRASWTPTVELRRIADQRRLQAA